MTLAGEEGKFPEDGPHGRQGAYAAPIVPTLCHCVFYHHVDLGEWGHMWGQKVELYQQDS